MEKTIIVTKLDAAKRQLETAIRLYFHNEDPVSIHTLVSAAYNVVRDVNRKQGGPPMLIKDEFIDVYVKPGHEREARSKFNEAENFFKHADQDPAGTLEFNPRASEFMIADAARGYFRITGEWTPLFQVFNSWLIAVNENLFKAESKQKFADSARAARSVGRTRFFELMLPVVARTGAAGRPQKEMAR